MLKLESCCIKIVVEEVKVGLFVCLNIYIYVLYYLVSFDSVAGDLVTIKLFKLYLIFLYILKFIRIYMINLLNELTFTF